MEDRWFEATRRSFCSMSTSTPSGPHNRVRGYCQSPFFPSRRYSKTVFFTADFTRASRPCVHSTREAPVLPTSFRRSFLKAYRNTATPPCRKLCGPLRAENASLPAAASAFARVFEHRASRRLYDVISSSSFSFPFFLFFIVENSRRHVNDNSGYPVKARYRIRVRTLHEIKRNKIK